MLTDKHAHAFLWGGGSIFVSGSLVTVYVAAISCNKKAPEKRRGACWGGAAEKTEKEGHIQSVSGSDNLSKYLEWKKRTLVDMPGVIQGRLLTRKQEIDS